MKKYAKKMSRIRSKTVEPVIGTLVNFTNMKRVNTRGIKKRKQACTHGKFNLQLEEILAFYHQKTIHFSPSDISKTRDMLYFFKTSLFSLQKRDCKLFKFLQFELQLKNKPPLKCFKRG